MKRIHPVISKFAMVSVLVATLLSAGSPAHADLIPATISGTPGSGTVDLNGSWPDLSGVSVSPLEAGVSCDSVISGSTAVAGSTFAWTCSVTDTTNYSGSVSGTFTVSKATASISGTPGSGTVDLNGSWPDLSGVSVSPLEAGVSCDSVISGSTAVAGSTFAWTCSVTDTTNYSGSVSGTFTVSKATATFIGLPSSSIPLGGPAPNLGAVTTDPLEAGASCTGSFNSGGGVNVAGSVFSWSCDIVSSNYTASHVTGTSVVSQGQVTITAGSYKIYEDDALPTVGFSASSPGYSGSAITCTTSATSSTAGTYSTSCSGTDPNYTFTFVTGLLSVVPKSSVVIEAKNQVIYVGDILPQMSYTLATNEGLLKAPICQAYNGETALTSTEIPGTYSIRCSGASVATGFTPIYKEGILKVLPAVTLQIKATNSQAYVGGPLPTGTFTISEPGHLSVVPECFFYDGDSKLEFLTKAGQFEVRCSGAEFLPGFNATYLSGILTVTESPVAGVNYDTLPVIKFTSPLRGTFVGGTAMSLSGKLLSQDGGFQPVVLVVPAATSKLNLRFLLSPASNRADILGYPSILVSAVDASGVNVQKLDGAVSLTINSAATGASPVWSNDGIKWTLIPKLSARSLKAGEADGYFINSDGSYVIFTKHPSYLAIRQQQNTLKISSVSAGKKIAFTAAPRVAISGGNGTGVLSVISLTPKICKISASVIVSAVKAGTCSVYASRLADSQYANRASSPISFIFKNKAGTVSPKTPESTTISKNWKKLTGLTGVSISGSSTGSLAVVVGSSAAQERSLNRGQGIQFKLDGLVKNSVYSVMIIGPNGASAFAPSVVASQWGTATVASLKFDQPGTYRILIKQAATLKAQLLTLEVL